MHLCVRLLPLYKRQNYLFFASLFLQYNINYYLLTIHLSFVEKTKIASVCCLHVSMTNRISYGFRIKQVKWLSSLLLNNECSLTYALLPVLIYTFLSGKTSLWIPSTLLQSRIHVSCLLFGAGAVGVH